MADESGSPQENSADAEFALGAELTLSDVMAGKPVPIDGTGLYLRWPSPEEYDDALNMQRLVRKRELRRPEVADLRDEPASEEAQALYKAMVVLAENSFREADTDKARDYWNGQIAAWARLAENANLAEEIANERGALARDRWFVMHLLCLPNGERYFDPHAKDFAERWRTLPHSTKDAARPVLMRMMRAIDEVPFVSAMPPVSP